MYSYKQDRHNWAIRVQEKCAIPIYQQLWPGCIIEEVDKIGLNGNDFAKRRDFSGLDKIILVNHNELHLAQRFRGYEPLTKRYMKGYDFSLRYKTPGRSGQKDAEYFTLIEAVKHDMWIPNKYIWGVTKTDDPTSGFSALNIYNVRKMVISIIRETIKPIGVYSNGDGSSGIYFRLNDLRPFLEWELSKGLSNLSVQSTENSPTKRSIGYLNRINKQTTLESY